MKWKSALFSLASLMLFGPVWSGPYRDLSERFRVPPKPFQEKVFRQFPLSGVRTDEVRNPQDVLLPSFGKIENADAWGQLSLLEDGAPVFFTQQYKIASYVGYTPLYEGTTLDFYDSSMNRLAEIELEVPNTTNSIQVFGQVSRHFFNADDKLEFLIYVHYGQDEKMKHEIYVVNEESRILQVFADAQSAEIYQVVSGYDRYAKFIIYSTSDDNSLLTVQLFRLPASGEAGLQPEHTFTVDFELAQYLASPIFDYYQIGEETYYVVSHYKYPFIEDPDTMTPTPDNKFIIEIYDQHYLPVRVAELDIIEPEKELLNMISFGMFSSEDVSRHYFNEDDKFEFIVGVSRYYISTDSELVDYYLMNEDNEVLKAIGEKVSYTMPLSPVPGCEKQVALLQAGETERMTMIDLPSLNEVVSFEARHQGNLLSTNFDRFPVDGTYQYVFGLGEGISDDQGNVLGRIGWYDTSGNEKKMVTFNLGPDAQLFTPYITAYTLNPYLFNTDADFEYIFLTKDSQPGTSSLLTTLHVVKEDGTELIGTSADAEMGSYFTGGVSDNGENPPFLYISYRNDEDKYGIRFYSLPLTKFEAGGEGTEENPYLISSTGDLNAMRYDLSAHYALVNNIDMKDYWADDGMGWKTPGSLNNPFKGTLDGRGFTIANLYKEGRTDYVNGFIGYAAEGAVIKNLYFTNPVIRYNKDNSYVGVVCGSIQSGEIYDCHVIEGRIEGDRDAEGQVVGGITGQAVLQSRLSADSFDGEIISPAAGAAGGIIGEARTGTRISACKSTGRIVANTSTGGIAGQLGFDCGAENIYSVMDITGGSSLGGIAGEIDQRMGSRGYLKNAYAGGKITGVKGTSWFDCDAGGLVGYLSEEWNHTEGVYTVQQSLALNPSVSVPEGSTTYHRIVGFTGEEDVSLVRNYALAGMPIGITGSEAPVSSDEDFSPHGKDITYDELTPSFFRSVLGWEFGTDTLHPWMFTEAPLPVLYFEYRVRGIEIDRTEATMTIGEVLELQFSLVPENAINRHVGWSSSDASLAEVDENGRVTAKAEGTAVITVTAEDGGYTARCKITIGGTGVTDPSSDGIKIYYDTRSCLIRIENLSGIREAGILNMNGVWCYRTSVQHTDIAVSCRNWLPGIYLVRMVRTDGVSVWKKVAVY